MLAAVRVSADIGFCPPVAMNDCPLTAVRPLSVIGKRTFARAAYRHLSQGVFGVSVRYQSRSGGHDLQQFAGHRSPECPLGTRVPADLDQRGR